MTTSIRIRRPFSTEWDTSRLPSDRRAYLDGGISFEEIVARLTGETTVIRSTIYPYRSPPPAEAKQARGARQIVFSIRARHETCDQLYNAPDGLRGRYWQSPDHGSAATRHLINALVPTLTASTEGTPPTPIGKVIPMTTDDVRVSLEAPSAKVWPQERDDRQSSLFFEDQLGVPRWRQNERQATINMGMWRRSPRGGELEVKGAILGPDGTEYVPEFKRDRSYQIFQFGFT